MGRIADAFDKANNEGRAALVIYLCAGDPSLEWTKELVLAATRGGADIIELGIPFSDPTADGPTIQQASARALAAGTTLGGVFEIVRDIRSQSEVPILLFGYYNPILAFGEQRAVETASAAGADGFLVVDLPPEEGLEFRTALHEEGLDFVPLLAPTSDDVRIQQAGKVASSFIYYVSLTGVTGTQAVQPDEVGMRLAELREQVSAKLAVGFGIRTGADVARVAAGADGVVVGSAVVREIAAAADLPEAVERVEAKVRELSGGLHKT
jgi:tryptophan synthase alpha chain